MKKIILSLLALSMFAVGCSEESAIDYNGTPENSGNAKSLTGRSAVWDGEIGVDVNGVYRITADQAAIKADFNNILKREGNPTTIQSLAIVKKVAVDNPADVGYMLVGLDHKSTSIGVWLVRTGIQFYHDNTFVKSTSCTGCAQGCNLDYLTIDGKKVAFCNENGCTYDCTKGESSF